MQILVRRRQRHAHFLFLDRRSDAFPAARGGLPLPLGLGILLLPHRLIRPIPAGPALIPLIPDGAALAKPEHAAGDGGQDPRGESEPNTDADGGGCARNIVDPCASNVEHDGVDNERDEGECRGEPLEKCGEAEEGKVGDEVEQGEEDSRHAGA